MDDTRKEYTIRGKITKTLGEVTFNSNFDSGNLDRVEHVGTNIQTGEREYDLLIAPDCAGTEYENSCRTWFYYSVSTTVNYDGKLIKMNIKNLNKQGRLYQQGHAPLFRTLPGKGVWEKMREKPEWQVIENGISLSFSFAPPELRKSITFFAFCYPFSYTDCQKYLTKIEQKIAKRQEDGEKGEENYEGDKKEDNSSIYYHRDLLCYSLDGLRIDLLTISSNDGIVTATEPRLPGTFPNESVETARQFKNKKVVFITSRVHPGETPSSFVFNGFLDFLLRPDDLRATALLRNFVFKLIPMINPDGVSRGHYRTDSRGINLNRVYLEPDLYLHPSVYAIRQLIMYYHGQSKDSSLDHSKGTFPYHSKDSFLDQLRDTFSDLKSSLSSPNCQKDSFSDYKHVLHSDSAPSCSTYYKQPAGTGVALYVDLHAHATKRSCFMYGNHFQDISDQSECMILPRLVSLNSAHFDFEHCLFSERNMYATDKRTGVSKEGSGRVALYKATGLIHCYTLECNYNSGRIVNQLTPATMDSGRATPPSDGSPIPHKLTAKDYEEVGRGLGVALLDLYKLNPWSRLPTSQYCSLSGLRESIKNKTINDRKRAMEVAKNNSLTRGGGGAKRLPTTTRVEAPPPPPPTDLTRKKREEEEERIKTPHPPLLLSKPNNTLTFDSTMPHPYTQLRPTLTYSDPTCSSSPPHQTPTHKIKSPFRLPLIRNNNRQLTTPPQNVALLMIGTSPLKSHVEQATPTNQDDDNTLKQIQFEKLHIKEISLASSPPPPPLTCVFPEDFLSIVGQNKSLLQSKSLVIDESSGRGGKHKKKGGAKGLSVSLEPRPASKGRQLVSLKGGGTQNRKFLSRSSHYSKSSSLPTFRRSTSKTYPIISSSSNSSSNSSHHIPTKTSLIKVNHIRSSTSFKTTNRNL